MQKITPFLWFDGKAEQAIKFYVSIFKNSKILQVHRHGKKFFSGIFILEGQKFMALNGGPHFKFTPAISFFVNCKTQQEIDRLWMRLSKGGKPQRCGWLTYKFGVSWQIIPSILGDLLQDKDDKKAGRVMNAMLGMRKIDINGLKKAYANR
jgi:predicted 3-demethylubiquinone-9 3-methyltransferase (glyoxalase superfamily)